MVKGLLLLFSVMFIISCKSGSGGGGGGVKGVNINPNGFKPTAPATIGDLPERYTVGCVTPGSDTPTYQIDSRLRVGHEFGIDVRDSDETGYKAATAIQKIIGVTADSISLNYRITSNVNFPIPGNSFDEVCTRTADGAGGYNWVCDERALTTGSTKSIANEGCVVHADSMDNVEETITKGVFLGRKAYFVTYAVRGKVLCNDDTVDLGAGSLVWNTVYSNQVPATDITYCGGSSMFFASQTQLASGKVLSAGMFSYTNAPTVAE